MTAFDFDSAEHQAYEKTPAAKSIPSPAGIWIASQVLSTANEEGERGKDKGKTLLFYRCFNS